MKQLWIALVLCAACGGKKPAQQPPSNTGSGSGAGSGSGSATADCPATLDCMPPTDGPCPPPGFKERCPNTQITY